jgi:hypothetical protein
MTLSNVKNDLARSVVTILRVSKDNWKGAVFAGGGNKTDASSQEITPYLSYSMEQSPPWQTNRFSFSQKISRIFWNPVVM